MSLTGRAAYNGTSCFFVPIQKKKTAEIWCLGFVFCDYVHSFPWLFEIKMECFRNNPEHSYIFFANSACF